MWDHALFQRYLPLTTLVLSREKLKDTKKWVVNQALLGINSTETITTRKRIVPLYLILPLLPSHFLKGIRKIARQAAGDLLIFSISSSNNQSHSLPSLNESDSCVFYLFKLLLLKCRWLSGDPAVSRLGIESDPLSQLTRRLSVTLQPVEMLIINWWKITVATTTTPSEGMKRLSFYRIIIHNPAQVQRQKSFLFQAFFCFSYLAT